ncbi:MAG TPA: hypothetical protein VK116_03230 [Planctomycetota bacterium]|nr:hypothetical protein [Planctomycetota bacterium]
MSRRILTVLVGALSLTMVGCQKLLPKAGTYSEIKEHAMRIDWELGQLHTDIKDIVFGIEPAPKEPIWRIYDED